MTSVGRGVGAWSDGGGVTLVGGGDLSWEGVGAWSGGGGGDLPPSDQAPLPL